jgi:predicted transcriptional regulator
MTKENTSAGGVLIRSGRGWSPREDGWNQAADPQPAPAAPAATPARDAINDELDREASDRAAALRKAGLTDEEIGRHTGATGKPQAAPAQASLQARLDEVRAMRTSRPKDYWSAPIQEAERELIAAIERSKSGKVAPAKTEDAGEGSDPATGEAEPTATEAKLAELREELDQIAEARKADRKRYDERAQQRERELLAEIETVELGRFIGQDIASDVRETWGDQGGVEARLGVVAGMVRSLTESFTPEQTQAFGTEFDRLPAAARVQILDHFSVSDGSLSARRAAIERSLSGTELSAVKAFWSKWGSAVEKGLVR